MLEQPHNISLTPYHYCNNNPILFIDINGEDWFVNSETGSVLYVKGVSDLQDAKIDYGKGWENFGSDDMFGKEVMVGDENVLERPDYEFGPSGAEEFMSDNGYEKGERIQKEQVDYETHVTDDGTMSGRTIKTKWDVQVGDSELTYAKPENFNKREQVRSTSHADPNQKYTKENYSTVVPYGSTKPTNSTVDKNHVINGVLRIIGNVVSIITE